MSAQAAARMSDEVAHGFGLLAMVGGALLGAAVGAAIIGATAATGGAALAIAAGSVAAGGLSLGQLVKGVTQVFNLPEPTSGLLQSGSPNVRINSRSGIRTVLDIAACSGFPCNHPPLPAVPVAEGSASVRINGMPAARLGSKMMCGAHVKSGSPNVQIGGATARMAGVYDSEEWMEWGLTALGIFAIGVAGRAIYLAGGKLAAARFAGSVLVGLVGFEGIGQLGDAIGPGYRDLFQGVAGLALLGLGLKGARNARQQAEFEARQRAEAEAEARQKAAQEARSKAEQEAKQKAEQETQEKAQKEKAEKEARLKEELKQKVAQDAADIKNSGMSGNEKRKLAASARVASRETGEILSPWNNLPASVDAIIKEPGIIENVGEGSYKILDSKEFLKRIEKIYADNEIIMHGDTKKAIAEAITEPDKIFSKRDGMPGLHADVLSYNESLLKAWTPENTVMSVYNIMHTSEFPACNNCSDIIPKSLEIITGRDK